ncbi:MAG: hypothetical protein HQL50_02115 [Magnetococcales bacterium]|nr:hypothetical protein [Magnetococcales bacterium]
MNALTGSSRLLLATVALLIVYGSDMQNGELLIPMALAQAPLEDGNCRQQWTSEGAMSTIHVVGGVFVVVTLLAALILLGVLSAGALGIPLLAIGIIGLGGTWYTFHKTQSEGALYGDSALDLSPCPPRSGAPVTATLTTQRGFQNGDSLSFTLTVYRTRWVRDNEHEGKGPWKQKEIPQWTGTVDSQATISDHGVEFIGQWTPPEGLPGTFETRRPLSNVTEQDDGALWRVIIHHSKDHDGGEVFRSFDVPFAHPDTPNPGDP